MKRPLMIWGARAVGPCVRALLIPQLVAFVLVAGLASGALDALVNGVLLEPLPRALLLSGLALAIALSRESYRRALCPEAVAALRRQPLGGGAFALLVLPWALPLAWPWALIAVIAHPSSGGVLVATTLAGVLVIVGAASAARFLPLTSWTLLPLAVALVADHHPSLAWPLAFALVTVGVPLAGRTLRHGAGRIAVAMSPRTRRGTVARRLRGHRPYRTPMTALVGIDTELLRSMAARWLGALLLPTLCTAYLLVLRHNGNCGAECTDGAALLILASGALPGVAVLATLRRCHGTKRLLVPDRIVPTRLRLGTLALVTLAPSLPFAVVLGLLSREAALLPHAITVVAAVLFVQLLRPDREGDIALVLWFVLPPTLALLLTSGIARVLIALVVAASLVALVDRRAAALRRAIMAGSWSVQRA